MRLTNFTDYALRVIIYAGLKKERSSVAEIAAAFNVSKNHLIKVVHKLSTLGLIETAKGRGGGIELSSKIGAMKLGEIVSLLEPDMNLVECFNRRDNHCPLIGACELEHKLYAARKAFLESLNSTTVQDLLRPRGRADLRLAKLGLIA